MKISTEDKVEREAFKLELPEVFEIAPEYSVDLPLRRKALIYATTVRKHVVADGKEVMGDVPGWRVYIVRKDGTPIDRRGATYYYDDEFTTADPLRVAMYIRQLSAAFAKTKRTTVQDVDQGDD